MVTGYGFPSDKAKNIGAVAIGDTRTAPADGWFYMDAVTSAANGWIVLRCTETNVAQQEINPYANSHIYCLFPISSGQHIAFSGGNVNIDTYKFIYAKGAAE